MKVESRVEVLEHELKILKNEIQATLLEIREQVLNHYYPELRAEEPTRAKLQPAKASEAWPSERMSEIRTNEVRASEVRSSMGVQAKAMNQPRGQASTPGATPSGGIQVPPFSDSFLQNIESLNLDDVQLDEEEIQRLGWDKGDEADDGLDELDHEDEQPTPVRATSDSPQMREVGLQQLRQAQSTPKVKGIPTPNQVAQPSQKPSRTNFAALAAWVGNAVAKVGKQRTTQVVETYAASGGALSNEMKATILQMTALASDVEPVDTIGNNEMLGLMVELDQILSGQ